MAFGGEISPAGEANPELSSLGTERWLRLANLLLQKLAELGMQAEVEKNRLEDIVCALAVAGQHEYAGAYFRNQSLSWFMRDRKG